MIASLMLSTAFANSQNGKRAIETVTCGPTGFWTKVKSKVAFRINESKNKLMADNSINYVFSNYNRVIQDLVGLQQLENRVSCLDANQETKPCTELYTKATCQEVAKFFRSDEGDSNDSTCQPIGEVDGKTQLECKRARGQRPVCNGTFYVQKTSEWKGFSEGFSYYRKPTCLEGWTYAAGYSASTKWNRITDVDCNNPACVEISKEDRMEAARLKALDETKKVLYSYSPISIGARVKMTDGQKELLKSLEKVLDNKKTKTKFVIEVVGELVSNKWDQFKEWVVELF